MQLSSPAPDFSDPLGLLGACHGRIKAQCATLLRLPDYLRTHGCDEQVRQAAAKALRYFDSAGRHHHEDEEANLFPILRRHATATGDHAVLQILHQLETQHRAMEQTWAELAPLLRRLVQGEMVVPEALPVARFAELYHAHMATEDEHILPLARQVLSAADLQVLGRHMAERRKTGA
ncbi:MAG: hemerythrin domain-containing protein [Pseudomonadota bacterium]